MRVGVLLRRKLFHAKRGRALWREKTVSLPRSYICGVPIYLFEFLFFGTTIRQRVIPSYVNVREQLINIALRFRMDRRDLRVAKSHRWSGYQRAWEKNLKSTFLYAVIVDWGKN